MNIYLFDLGERPWYQSMLIFHALARMNIEALVLVSPKTPYISVGYFQDVNQEVSLDYCKKENLPIIRREVGGGTVYLDRNQIFYHIIWNKDNKEFPKKISDIYKYLSTPPIETYGEFGIETKFREINDIITSKSQKIAGLGGAEKAKLSKMNMAGLGKMMIKGKMKKNNVASLQELIKDAGELGVRLLACEMTMDLMNVPKDSLIPEVKEICGVGTYLDAASNSTIHQVF
jgi:peroxiredoxin family protein